tara:strand:+ start:863 stop:1381 length:519 start_codon:yes stop_codon:yes gene_type:complete
MEFLSPKTKERISKLEAENADLQRQLTEQKGSDSKKSLLPFVLVIVLLSALSVYQFLGTSTLTEDEIAQKSVELWRAGDKIDTVFTPSDKLIYSVQIGAFKNHSIKELSYKFNEASLIHKDSLSLFVIGEYESLPDAQSVLGVVVKLGVENAFIIAQKNGNAVGLLTEQNRE